MGLNIHQRSEYGKPCAMKVACTVWSGGKAEKPYLSLLIRTTSANPLWTGFFVSGQSGRTSHPGVKPHPTSSAGIFTNFFAT